MEFRTVLKESLIYCNIYNSFSFVTYLVTTTWEACKFKILWVTECPTFPVYKSVSRKSYPWICFFFSEEFENNKTSAVEELSQPYQGGRLEQTQDSRSYQPELLHWVAGCRTSLSHHLKSENTNSICRDAMKRNERSYQSSQHCAHH